MPSSPVHAVGARGAALSAELSRARRRGERSSAAQRNSGEGGYAYARCIARWVTLRVSPRHCADCYRTARVNVLCADGVEQLEHLEPTAVKHQR